MTGKLEPLSVSACPETQIILFRVMKQRVSHCGTCRIGAQKRLFRDAKEPFPHHERAFSASHYIRSEYIISHKWLLYKALRLCLKNRVFTALHILFCADAALAELPLYRNAFLVRYLSDRARGKTGNLCRRGMLRKVCPVTYGRGGSLLKKHLRQTGCRS